jgi:biotin operon repressor
MVKRLTSDKSPKFPIIIKSQGKINLLWDLFRIFAKLTPKTKRSMKEQVLQAMREAGKPVSAGEVTKVLNADRKEVDKAFAELKKEGAIVSPVRCKWQPA